MSENKKYSSFMSETEIKNLSVTALSNRPNERSGQYGKKGLTPEQLKAAFSALPEAIAHRLNEVMPELVAYIDDVKKYADDQITAANGAVKEYVDGQVDTRVEKLTPDSETFAYPYVYTVDKDRKHSLMRTHLGGAPNTIVLRDEEGYFTVQLPKEDAHPVNKRHFDTKTNNSLYGDLVRAESRIANLEHLSNGKLYDTVELNSSGSALQVEEALPYGILSHISGNVKTVSVGLPYTFDGDSFNITKLTEDSFVAKASAMPYIQCKTLGACNVTVSYTYTPSGSFWGYAFFKGVSNMIGDGNVGSGTVYNVTESAKFIALTRTNNNKDQAVTVSEFRVIFDDPTKANVETVIEEIKIPDSITSLEGYGKEGNYLDLTERKFYRTDGSSEDVSESLPAECDVISLLPGSIIKFTDADGEPVTAGYTFSYKNKINT